MRFWNTRGKYEVTNTRPEIRGCKYDVFQYRTTRITPQKRIITTSYLRHLSRICNLVFRNLLFMTSYFRTSYLRPHITPQKGIILASKNLVYEVANTRFWNTRLQIRGCKYEVTNTRLQIWGFSISYNSYYPSKRHYYNLVFVQIRSYLRKYEVGRTSYRRFFRKYDVAFRKKPLLMIQ